jgi:hypothetical protein
MSIKRERNLSLKIQKPIDEALEEARWCLRMNKTEIVETAIVELLKRKCPDVYKQYLEGIVIKAK